jgi:hypothetical protein
VLKLEIKSFNHLKMFKYGLRLSYLLDDMDSLWMLCPYLTSGVRLLEAVLIHLRAPLKTIFVSWSILEELIQGMGGVATPAPRCFACWPRMTIS